MESVKKRGGSKRRKPIRFTRRSALKNLNEILQSVDFRNDKDKETAEICLQILQRGAWNQKVNSNLRILN